MKASSKVQKAHSVQNYLGLPDISGKDMQKAFIGHIDSMGIQITEEKVTMVYPMGSYFSIQTSSNQILEARTVILAAGMIAAKNYPGENEFLGRGVSYCATCDGPLYRGKTVAVIASSAEAESEADYLQETAGRVYYFPLYKEEVHTAPGIEVRREKPQEILGDMKVSTLRTDQAEYPVDGIFVLRESIAPGQLVPGLEMDGPHVKTARDMSTNIEGLFACGDITGTPYQYIKAAGEGNTAALGAVRWLDSHKEA